VNDPAFYEKLYRQDGRWDKYGWSTGGFPVQTSTVNTPDHDVHKHRRAALNSFFSKARVNASQDVIHRTMDKFCRVLDNVSLPAEEDVDQADSKKRQSFNLGACISAFTRDAASEFCTGVNWNDLDKPESEFNKDLAGMMSKSGYLWRIQKHVRWVKHLLEALPLPLVAVIGGKQAKTYFYQLKQVS